MCFWIKHMIDTLFVVFHHVWKQLGLMTERGLKQFIAVKLSSSTFSVLYTSKLLRPGLPADKIDQQIN